MYKVQKLTIDKKVSEEYGGVFDIVTTQTLFRSAVLKDCIRYLYSCRNKQDIFVTDRVGTVVDVGDYVD